MYILKSIGAAIAAGLITVSSWFSPVLPQTPVQEVFLGADATNPVAGTVYTLAGSGVSGSATSITLVSLTIPQTGYELLDADFSSTFYLTLEPGSRTRQEIASCTTVTQNANNTATLSGCTRGLLPFTPYTASSSYQFAHGGGTSVVFSNPPQLYAEFAGRNNDETITGDWMFTTPARVSSSVATSSIYASGYNYATVNILSDVVANGAVNGSETAKGIYELATGAELASSTSLGSTGARLVAPASAFSSTTSAANLVPVTDANGKLANGFLDSTQFVPVGSMTMYATTTAPTGWLLADGSAVSRTTYSSLFATIGTSYGTGDASTTFNVPNLKSAFPLGYGQRTETITFLDGNVNTSTDLAVVSSTVWLTTGQAVALTNSGGTLPGGLSATTYYVIRDSATTTKFATTLANAVAGTAVDITSAAGGGTHTMTVTLTSRTIAAEGGEETHALTTAEIPSHTHVDNAITNTGSNAEGGSGELQYQGATVTGATGGSGTANNMPPFVVVNYIIKY